MVDLDYVKQFIKDCQRYSLDNYTTISRTMWIAATDTLIDTVSILVAEVEELREYKNLNEERFGEES